jgi:F0F1-type ATP synthase beta subunit
VAEVHTQKPGRYVPVQETIRGFNMILNGELDHISEPYFHMCGPIEDVLEAARKAG